jgi:hypothetical protein
VVQYNPKVGKQGGAKPQETISGNPLPAQWASTRSLGNSYYVVWDAYPSDDAETIFAALVKEFSQPPKPKRGNDEPKKPGKESRNS